MPKLRPDETPTADDSTETTAGEGQNCSLTSANESSDKKPRAGFHGKPGRSGAPKGNHNAGRHYMCAGKLPPELAYVENRLNKFRRNIEAQLMEAHGKISVVAACLLNTALKWEKVGVLANRAVTKQGDTMSEEKKLDYYERAAKASDNRDRALSKLGLDIDPNDKPWATALVVHPVITDAIDANSDKGKQL